MMKLWQCTIFYLFNNNPFKLVISAWMVLIDCSVTTFAYTSETVLIMHYMKYRIYSGNFSWPKMFCGLLESVNIIATIRN